MHLEYESGIATFRYENFEAVAACFLHVLEWAHELKLLKLGKVSVDGTQLVLSTHVSQCASDRNELVAGIRGIAASLGHPATVLADNGYLNEEQVRGLDKVSGEWQLVTLAYNVKRL